jgi:hypothetical protein
MDSIRPTSASSSKSMPETRRKTRLVMRTLSRFVEEDMAKATPLKVTYIGNSKPKIVKYLDTSDLSSETSTESE